MKNGSNKADGKSLRVKADTELKKKKNNNNLNETESLRLLHELQVHQIELEMMNEELQMSRDRAEAAAEGYIELYDFAPTGYLSLHPDGSIIQLNLSCSKMLNIERSLLINQEFRRFLTQDSIAVFNEFLRKVFEDKEIVSCELMLRTENDITRFVYVEGLLDKSGEKCNLTMVDITSRKQMENELKTVLDELKRSNLELAHFAYVASHDLQEPLRMMSNYAKLLSLKYTNMLDSKAEEYIFFITEGAKRMQTLIHDLLLYSKVSTQKRAFEKTDIKKIIDNVLSDLSLTIMENNVEITVGELPVLLADITEMRQLFQNLIANSIKFRNEQKCKIDVSAKREEDKWLFRIKDNGIGLESKSFEQIFQPFQRLNDREKYPGNGIGLAVCKKIVEHHGGKIWVESEPGKGAAFYFTIKVNIK